MASFPSNTWMVFGTTPMTGAGSLGCVVNLHSAVCHSSECVSEDISEMAHNVDEKWSKSWLELG